MAAIAANREPSLTRLALEPEPSTRIDAQPSPRRAFYEQREQPAPSITERIASWFKSLFNC